MSGVPGGAPVSGWGPLYCGELQINRDAERGGMTGSWKHEGKGQETSTNTGITDLL